jgi:hypothetical protein
MENLQDNELILTIEQYETLVMVAKKLDYADDEIRNLALNGETDPKAIGFRLGSIYKEINSAFITVSQILENIHDEQIEDDLVESEDNDEYDYNDGAEKVKKK